MDTNLPEIEVLEKARDFAGAVERLKALLKESQGDEDIAFKLACNLLSLGRVSESLPLFEMTALHGDAPPERKLNYGHALKAAGSYEKAADQYYYLAQNPDHKVSASAYWSLANLKRYKFSDKDKSDIEIRLRDSKVGQGYVGLYRLTLADAFDQSCQYEKAFAELEAGNNSIGEIRPFRGDLYQKLIKELISDFQRSSVKCAEHGRCPIFVVGLPRSGSTLVEQILSSHSQVNSTDELLFISDIAKELGEKGNYAAVVSGLPEQDAYQLGEAYLQKIAGYSKNSELHFVDKTPENFVHVGLIKTIFPNAKIIDVHRDPLDNALSLYKQFFAQGREYSYSLNAIVFYWQGYLTLMKHWQSQYSGEIFRLDYEKLVTNPKESISKLLSYCGLHEEPSCFAPHKSPRPVLTPSAAQVTMPISSSSLGSGQNYKEYVTEYLPKFAQLKRVAASIDL